MLELIINYSNLIAYHAGVGWLGTLNYSSFR